MSEVRSDLAKPRCASVRLLVVYGGFHVVVMLIAIPAFLLAMSAAIGVAMARVEGWDTMDGILYIGGNLVLIPLTHVVPTSPPGKAIDVFVSILMTCLLGWGIAIIGLLPFCNFHGLIRCARHPILASTLSAVLFVLLAHPLVCGVVSAGISPLLVWAEDWTYGNSVLRVLGIASHLAKLGPKAQRPASKEGKIVILISSFIGVSFSLGWPVGVFLQMPALNSVAGFLDKVSVTRGDSFVAKCINYCIVVLILVPLLMFPLCLLLGFVVSEAEDWGSITTGAMYVGGTLVGVPLGPSSAEAPETLTAKVVDFVTSFVGIGCCGFIIAALGAMDFTDRCCEVVGGKVAGRLAAVKFTVLFYLVVVPGTCVICALPMAGILVAAEGWSFVESGNFVMSILGQAPSLAPAGLKPRSDGGIIAVFLLVCYSLCLTIGWGAGIVVASKALDGIGDRINGVLDTLKAFAGIKDEANAAETDAPPDLDDSQSTVLSL